MTKLRWVATAVILLCAAQTNAQPFIKGIDVYSGDGSVTWSSVKTGGYDFAFVKATEGVNFTDSRFTTNMTNANAAGVYVGPYHLARPDSKNGVPFTDYNGGAFSPTSTNQTNRDAWEDATSEASDFLDVIKPFYLKTGSTRFLKPVLDMELSKIPDFDDTGLEKTFVSNWTQVFSDAILASLGVRPLMYLSKSNANTYWTSSIASQHQFWIAQYKGTGVTDPPEKSETPLWPAWKFWQWSDGSDAIAKASLVPGVSGSPDRDVFSGTTADLAALRLQIPEPASIAILCVAGGAMMLRRRYRSGRAR